MDTRRKKKMANGHARWTDRILGMSLAIVGTLTLILWGILWTNVSAADARLNVLESAKGVIETKLDVIGNDVKDIKLELKQRRNP